MSGQHSNTTALEHGIVAVDTEYARPLQDASHLIIENGRAAYRRYWRQQQRSAIDGCVAGACLPDTL